MITPLDIRKVEFNRSFRGYDPAEVQAYLESVAAEMEKVVRENGRLGEKLNGAEERLTHFKLIEKTLQDSVLTLQTTLDEKRKNAEQEAELIVQEARMKATAEMAGGRDQVKELRRDIQALDNQKGAYFIRFKNFLLSQLEWLEAMEKSGEVQRPEPIEPPHPAHAERLAHPAHPAHRAQPAAAVAEKRA